MNEMFENMPVYLGQHSRAVVSISIDESWTKSLFSLYAVFVVPQNLNPGSLRDELIIEQREKDNLSELHLKELKLCLKFSYF